MPRDFPRSRRIEEQIQRILSDVIRTRARDPRLHQAVISGVDVSRDLSVAWVYFTSLDLDQSQQELQAAFEAAGGFLRRQLAGELTVRHVPELRFRFDDTTTRGAAMDDLIEGARERDRKARAGRSDDTE